MSFPLLLSRPAPEASLVREVRRAFPWLTGSAVAMAGLGLISLLGLALDPRELMGAPIWLKPTKFALSGILYAVTLAVLLRPLAGRRVARVVDVGVGAVLVLEVALIVVQVVRGVPSHFNVGTPLDAFIFSTMGIAIASLSALTAVAAVVLLRTPHADPLMKRAAIWGLALSLAGGSVGYLMTRPTPAQLDALRVAPPEALGAHTVGEPDGGPGLPLTNWSTTAGDLRVPHFWGLHGLQALPLLALVLGGIPLSARQRRRLLHVGALSWGSVFAVLLWQALRGQPVLAPDAATLVASGAVVLLTALAAALILRSS